MAKRYCPDPENTPRAGEKVIITRSNNVQTSKKEKKLLGEDTDTGREERRTGVVLDGDEETKVAEHKLDFGRKQLKALFKNPVSKAFFRPRRGIPWVLARGKKDQSPLHARKGTRYTPEAAYTSDRAHRNFLALPNTALGTITPSVLRANP